MTAALEEKKVDLQKENFFDPGYAVVNSVRLRCLKRKGHGSQTFLEVVENSCNSGCVEMGERLGKKKHYSNIYVRLDLAQKQVLTYTAKEQVAVPLKAATTAFGQGVAVTLFQQVTAVSAAVNGGILYKPYLLPWGG